MSKKKETQGGKDGDQKNRQIKFTPTAFLKMSYVSSSILTITVLDIGISMLQIILCASICQRSIACVIINCN